MQKIKERRLLSPLASHPGLRQIALMPDMVSKDQTYQNAMRNADKQEARTASDRVLQSVIFSIMADNMELFKQFNDNPAFKKWLSDMVFTTTYAPGKVIKLSESTPTQLLKVAEEANQYKTNGES
jgi:type I restriction enzyme R subunit